MLNVCLYGPSVSVLSDREIVTPPLFYIIGALDLDRHVTNDHGLSITPYQYHLPFDFFESLEETWLSGVFLVDQI